MAVWILMLCLIQTIECRNDVPTITDEQFDEARREGLTFSVYIYNNKVPGDEVLNKILQNIRMSKADLEPLNINLGVVNCEKSHIPMCQVAEKLNHVIVYKEHKPFATINGDNLQTLLEIQVYMKHYAGLDEIDEVMNNEEYGVIQQRYAGKRDLIISYIPSMGSIEHLRMLNVALQFKKGHELFYTFKKDLFNDSSVMWYVDCIASQSKECMVVKSAEAYDDKSFAEYVQQSSLVTMLSSQNFPNTLKVMVNKGDNILVLIAGARKYQDALTLAKKVSSAGVPTIRTLLVDGTKFFHHDLQSRVQDDKIFALVSPGKDGNPKYLNIGFLESEDLDDVLDEFSIALFQQDEIWIPEVEVNEEDDEEEQNYKSRPEEVQDDPVAFSVHHTRHVKDLYYFDYKTIPRLTDKTYKTVTQSKDYSVILFTLEFNPKALATLVTFVEIHNAYKSMGKSPMYRVECYSWPDICQKAGVYPTPRMFFYPAGTTEAIEYDGMWDKVSMKEAIIRYSNPSVIVVRKKEDILPYLPITSRSIVGLFATEEGTAEFKKAAETLRKDYQFIELHGDVAKFVAEQYEMEYDHRRLLAFEHSFPKHKYTNFKTEQDIVDFCGTAFAAPELQELTIHSFVEVLRDQKPLFIYFWDIVDGNERVALTDIKDTIQDIAMQGTFADKVLFTWMDSSHQKTGEFVLGRYNHKAKLKKPIVAFFDKKGSVILKSCASGNCKNASLIVWLQDCIDGKLEPNYHLSTEEWKPRLAGYDYLEMMKGEGTFPAESAYRGIQTPSDDEETVQSSKGGRTVADLAHKRRKEMLDEKKHDRDVHNAEEEKQKSHATHTEL